MSEAVAVVESLPERCGLCAGEDPRCYCGALADVRYFRDLLVKERAKEVRYFRERNEVVTRAERVRAEKATAEELLSKAVQAAQDEAVEHYQARKRAEKELRDRPFRDAPPQALLLRWQRAARESPAIAAGVNVAEGAVTNRAVAETFGLPCRAPV